MTFCMWKWNKFSKTKKKTMTTLALSLPCKAKDITKWLPTLAISEYDKIMFENALQILLRGNHYQQCVKSTLKINVPAVFLQPGCVKVSSQIILNMIKWNDVTLPLWQNG